MTDLQTQGMDSDGLFVERPSSIKTFSGRVDPLNPDPEEIVIEDIAHALSRQCRYNGHCNGFLSVARHSIWVSDLLFNDGHDPRTQLSGLLHDAAEAYLGDLVRPLKHTPFGQMYLEAEGKIEAVICEKFGVPYPIPEVVMAADNYILTEIELPRARFDYYGDYEIDEEDFLGVFETLMELV